MSRLDAVGLGFAYGEHRVLEGVDLTLDPGTVTLLAGCNGAGKSTLLTILGGMRAPDTGTVRIDDDPIGAMSSRARARAVTFIPQDSDTSFEFTGREVVMMGRHPHIARFGTAGPDDLAAVEEALELTDSHAFADRSVRTLSGGELRRIHIARALATRAPVILADEPTANVDSSTAIGLVELMQQLHRERGATFLLATHDLRVMRRAERLLWLEDGRIAYDGPPSGFDLPQ